MKEYKHPDPVKPSEWDIGERYFLPNGTEPFTLLAAKPGENQGEYRCKLKYEKGSYWNHSVKVLHRVTNTPQEETNMGAKYKFTLEGKQTFGNKIAVNSSGLWVMEVVNSGDVVAIKKDKVEEVIPYTVGIKFLGGKHLYHYLAPKDKFDLGFYLVETDSGIYLTELCELDTKAKEAKSFFTPRLKFTSEYVDISS